MEFSGLDSDSREFKNAEEMWKEQVGDPNKKTEWYRNGVGYWEGVEASMDGVLGGFANVNEADITASEAFLKTLLSERFPNALGNQPLVALDCGSGIGRVTKNLLIRYFNENIRCPVQPYILVRWDAKPKFEVVAKLEQLLKESYRREEHYLKILVGTYAIIGCLLMVLLKMT